LEDVRKVARSFAIALSANRWPEIGKRFLFAASGWDRRPLIS
jgi:hypothetical protein